MKERTTERNKAKNEEIQKDKKEEINQKERKT